MVIEVEALLLVGRGAESHRGSLQLLPWQGEMGQAWTWGWMEMAEKEGPAWSSPSLTHLPGWITGGWRRKQLPAWPTCPCGQSPRGDLLRPRAHRTPSPRDTVVQDDGVKAGFTLPAP